jgi:hypothetical protein
VLELDEVEGAAEAELLLCPCQELELLPLEPSKTSKVAVAPLGTVTTQKAPPPAPFELLPTISFTLFWLGSILHGRPLQFPPLQVISTPQVGIVFRNGVAASR